MRETVQTHVLLTKEAHSYARQNKISMSATLEGALRKMMEE